MINKLFLCPFFGELPSWMSHWERNSERLREQGYNFLFDNDERAFQRRVELVLDIECPPMWGHGKIWDYRPALGLLYEQEIKGYDFWGHTDFDCVYGRVEQFVSDEFLEGIDMHSNCATYVNGCWSLYRNTPQMNRLFTDHPLWERELTDPLPSGWAEREYSKLIENAHNEKRIVKAWTQWQVFEEGHLNRLCWEGEKLMMGKEEVMMAHFRRTKQWPPGCLP